ncbi:hypothetical protein Tco_1383906 [Tanacetum coccineum]
MNDSLRCEQLAQDLARENNNESSGEEEEDEQRTGGDDDYSDDYDDDEIAHVALARISVLVGCSKKK